MENYQPSDIEREALNLIDSERVAWDTSTTFITDRVAMNMKNLIRQCRKNWWGIFDEPIDPQTGRKKIWVPLTESVGETVVKNVDLDTKDVNFRAKKPTAVKFTSLVRSIVKNYLDDIMFGEKLDELETIIARDGTCVWKTHETKKDDCFKTETEIVDLLNVYIDPTAPDIQKAYRFTERALMYADEVKMMKGWINTDDLKTSISIPRNDGSFRGQANTTGTTKGLDVWESHGKYPEYLMTGKKEDKAIESDLRIVVSGLETGDRRVHIIERYKGYKPYEEAWYAKVPGRWYGKGIAEKLMMLQIQMWINTIVNIRINRAYVSQLGLFTIRRGSGITPQMISRLGANGAITVNSAEDIQQMVMQEASPSSYKDEDNAQTWAQRVTSAYEVVTGESLPADTSATATSLQSRSAQSQFALVKEQVGMFVTRWLKRQAIPTIFKNIKQGDLVRMAMDPEELVAWDEQQVNAALYKELNALHENGMIIDPQMVQIEQQRLMEKMKGKGAERFVKLLHDLDYIDYEVAIDITNESVDKAVIAQNLLQAMTAAPEYRAQILPQLFDMMGLSFTAPPQPPMNTNGQPSGPGGQPTPATPPNQGPQNQGRASTLINQGTYHG